MRGVKMKVPTRISDAAIKGRRREIAYFERLKREVAEAKRNFRIGWTHEKGCIWVKASWNEMV